MKKNKFFILALAAFSTTLLVFAGCSKKESSKKESSKSIDIEKLKASAPALESEFEFELTYDSNGVVITGYKGDYKPGNPIPLVIPATIQGFPVKEIGAHAFDKRYHLVPDFSAVVIPEGVEIIGVEAFNAQPELVTVVLPSSLKVIDNCAFFYNKKLTTIKLPENLTTIGSQAFSVTGLTSIDLPEGLLEIGSSAFSFTPLTTVTLPKSLKVLNERAFASCDKLAEINIPDGLSVAANINTGYYKDGNKDWKLYFLAVSKGSITFDEFFSGEKIKESLALQKKLQEHKTVSLDSSKLKKDAYGYVHSSDWNW